jgi:hypothetical protein
MQSGPMPLTAVDLSSIIQIIQRRDEFLNQLEVQLKQLQARIDTQDPTEPSRPPDELKRKECTINPESDKLFTTSGMKFNEKFREGKAPGSSLVEGEASTDNKTTISNDQPATEVTDEPVKVITNGEQAEDIDKPVEIMESIPIEPPMTTYELTVSHDTTIKPVENEIIDQLEDPEAITDEPAEIMNQPVISEIVTKKQVQITPKITNKPVGITNEPADMTSPRETYMRGSNCFISVFARGPGVLESNGIG